MRAVGPGAAGGDGVAGTAGDPITAVGTGDGADGTTHGGDGPAMPGIRITTGMVAGILPARNADPLADTLLTAEEEEPLHTQQTEEATLSATDLRNHSDEEQTDEITSALEITGLHVRLATQTDLQEITVTRAPTETEIPTQTETSAKIIARSTIVTTAKLVSNARSASHRAAAAALTEAAVSAMEDEADSAAEAEVDSEEADVVDADRLILGTNKFQ